MKSELDKFLACPLEKAVSYFKKQQLDYELREIKPPLKDKDKRIFKNKGSKRVLKIKEEANSYLITWSFQYKK